MPDDTKFVLANNFRIILRFIEFKGLTFEEFEDVAGLIPGAINDIVNNNEELLPDQMRRIFSAYYPLFIQSGFGIAEGSLLNSKVFALFHIHREFKNPYEKFTVDWAKWLVEH